MTPDEKASFEILVARNAEAVKAEGRKINKAIDVKNIETVTKGLAMGLTVEQCALLAGVSSEFVKNLKK